MSSTQPLIFRGIDGAECEDFIANLLQRAFDNGRARDRQYIAELASTCFRGEALRWYLGLDDDLHDDWGRLRRAMIAEYPHRSQRANEAMASSTIPTPAAAPPARPFSQRRAGTPVRSSEGEVIALPGAGVSSIPPPIGSTSRDPSPNRSAPESEPSRNEDTPYDELPVSHSLSAEHKRVPTRLRRSSSTASLIANAVPLAPPPPALRTMTGRIRVVTHGEQANRGYVMESEASVDGEPFPQIMLPSATVGTDAVLYELAASQNGRHMRLKNKAGGHCLRALLTDAGYLSTKGVVRLTSGPPGRFSSPYTYLDMWQLRDPRVVPELPRDPAKNAGWCEVSLILGHALSADPSPVLLLVPSSCLSEFTWTVVFRRRWEHVDFLFEEVE